MSSKKLNPFKDFQSDQIQRSSRKIFTAHYACRNAALNLTPVTGTTNGFIFQIINSLLSNRILGGTLDLFSVNFTRPLYGVGEHSTKMFFFLTWIRSFRIQKISPTFDKLKEIGNKIDEVCNSANSPFE